MKSEKLIIVGKSGAGKDYLLRKLVEEKGLKPALKTTTRPPRKFEKQGVTYDFISESKFKSSEFIVKQSFYVEPKDSHPTTYNYGYTKEEFDKSQVFIMTPGEISMINKDDRKNCFIVYLDIPKKVRESRLFKRNDKNDSIKRRMKGDDKDFKNFFNFDLRITDPEFTIDMVYDLMD